MSFAESSVVGDLHVRPSAMSSRQSVLSVSAFDHLLSIAALLAAAASAVEPSSANRVSAALMVAPSGGAAAERMGDLSRCCSVETVARHP